MKRYFPILIGVLLVVLGVAIWQSGRGATQSATATKSVAGAPAAIPSDTAPQGGASAATGAGGAANANVSPTNQPVSGASRAAIPSLPAKPQSASPGDSVSTSATTALATSEPGEHNLPHAGKRTIGDVLKGVDLTIPGDRERVVAEMKAIEDENLRAAIALAQELGLPLRTETPDGRVQEVAGIDENGQLLYRTTHNVNAAISTAANLIQAAPYGLNGNNILVGVWDAGVVRPTHQEMTNRVTVKNGATNADHATHVGGTIIASGVTATAKGMATAARIDSYDWDNDFSEMVSAGAASATNTNKVLVSNHSYGFRSGWRHVGGGSPYRDYEWNGSGTTASDIEQDFGRYNSSARDGDATAFSVPFMTIFWSAGNDRSDNPTNGAKVALSPGSGTVVTYNKAYYPPGDGTYRGGYENIGFMNLAKNVVTIGAVNDAVSGGVRATNNATMSDFSSWGPTDDGRIKPDLVANGVDLYSTFGTSDTAYDTMSGTSMASPNAAGTAVLVAQDYIRLFGKAPRSSTMKGLLIHTADDLGNPGPDYVNGWGLINAKAAVDLIRDHAAKPNRARLSESLITTSSNTITHTFVWDGVSPIRATICWTDPAGEATSTSDDRAPRLVNNLDLRVVSPNGVTNRPYVMPFVGTWTTNSMSAPATTGTNNTDNVEQVYIASPTVTGTYEAVVTYQGALSGGQQYYSLLISGSGELPDVVTGVSASALSSTSISVIWTASTGATSYVVLRDGVQIATVSSGTTFTDSGLLPDTNYDYGIVAVNSAGEATPSFPVTARTLAWIDDNHWALRLLTPESAMVSANPSFNFTGQAGSGLTNGITWSNAASGQAGFFASSRDWSHEIPLVAGSNVITFRSSYSLFQKNTSWDDPWNYSSSVWSSGMNGGSGFGAWILGATTTNAGHFIASSLYNMNMSWTLTYGFGLWANSGAVATAKRDFNYPMQPGDRFSIFFENNLITTNATSSVGFALADANDNNRLSFNFVGGQANYRIDAAETNRDTGIGWTGDGLTVGFELTGSNSYKVTVGSNILTGELARGGSISRLVVSNANAGAGDNYNLYLGGMSLHSVQDLSGVAEVSSPAIVVISKTDGIPDSWWQQFGIDAADRTAAGDFDKDGLSNALEYFAGTDPTVPGVDGAIKPHFDAGGRWANLDYRRSKAVDNATATPQWTTDLGSASAWSSDSFWDYLLEDNDTWELRRASVPWSESNPAIFLRLNIRLE